MNETDNINDLIFKYFKQEEICSLCERKILLCKNSTSTYLCEGSKCNDALDYFIDDNINDIKMFVRLEKIKKIKDNINN